MSDKPVVQKIVLAGVVLQENRVLVLQRHDNEKVFPGLWELPSGKREPLEPSEQSLLREIREEAGIDVKVVIPISVFDYQIEKAEEIRDSTQINFLVVPVGEAQVTLSEEHQNYAWASVDEIGKYGMSVETKQVVLTAFSVAAKVR